MSNEQMTDARAEYVVHVLMGVMRIRPLTSIEIDELHAAHVYVFARLLGDAAQPRVSDLLVRAIPFLRDEGGKYDDDGSNEPLELARAIEDFLSTSPSDESALSSASSAFDGGEVAPCPHGSGRCDCAHPPAQGEQQAVAEVYSSVRRDSGPKCSIQQVRLLRYVPDGTKLYTHPHPAAPAPVAGDDARDLIESFVQHADANECDSYPRKLVESAKAWLAGFRAPVAGDAVEVDAVPVSVLEQVLAEISANAKRHGEESRNKQWAEWLRSEHSNKAGAYHQAAHLLAVAIKKETVAALAQDRASQAGAVPDAVDFWVCPDCDHYYMTDGVTCDCHGRATQNRMRHIRMAPLATAPTPGAEQEVGRD